MTKILALSGKKQSGKNTSGNFLLGLKMVELGLIGRMDITSKGELQIYDMWGDTDWEGVFKYYDTSPMSLDFLDENIHPWYKIYSFADLLKRSVCIELLGLTEKQCFGSDEEKNTLTHLKWEDMPGVVSERTYENMGAIDMQDLIYHAPGFMTSREVMQFVGTEIFRKMYGNVWSQGTVNRIKKEGSEFAVICDCRFPNEVEAVQRAGGKVIRLTRCINELDQHPSEIALDNYEGFDAVVDNQNLSIGKQNEAVYKLLREWGYPLLDLGGL